MNPFSITIDECFEELLRWYSINGRTFLWRTSKDWYVVFLSEFLLVRTRAKVIERALSEILRAYPKPEDMCKDDKSLEFLESLLKRLGLIKRAKWIRESICKILEGEVDICNEKELLKLPGVGTYLSSILLNRVCNIPKPFVDSNVLRVLSRMLGASIQLDEAMRILTVSDSASKIANLCYALMDLAHIVCKPRKPKCNECPLKPCCKYAFRANV